MRLQAGTSPCWITTMNLWVPKSNKSPSHDLPGRCSVSKLPKHPVNVAFPLPMKQRQLPLGRGLARFSELDQRLQEPHLIAALVIERSPARKPCSGNLQRADGKVLDLAAAERQAQRMLRHPVAQGVALFQAEVLDRSQAASSEASSYSRPTQNADSAHSRFHGPPSAPRISRNFFSRTSGKAVVMWSVQSVSVGSSPGSAGSLPARKSRKLWPLAST